MVRHINVFDLLKYIERSICRR